jgi:protein gp37
MGTTAIEWTDATWNPVTGCTKISAGCDHCYAERFSERFRGVPGHPFQSGFDLTLRPARLGKMDLSGIDWVIVGGESGPGARYMDPDWVREVRDQCVAAGVAFFFKQWGGLRPKSGGRKLDRREWSQFPQRPALVAAE